MSFVVRRKYDQDKQIFIYPLINETSVNIGITNDYILPDANSEKNVPAGMFLAKVGNTVRHLPRLSLTTATSTGAATVVGSPVVQFVAGDVLYAATPWAAVTLSATLAANDTATVTIAGHSVVSTAADTNLTTFAALIATNINADPMVSQLVTAIASGASVFIFSKTITKHSITVAETGAGLTFAVDGGLTALEIGTAVGTVSSIDVATNTITLTGNAGVALPVGAKVGVPVNMIYGLDPMSHDLTDKPTYNLAIYTSSSGVKTDELPYIDHDVMSRFPKIIFQELF